MDLHPGRSLNLISLCTGGGGLDRAFELACPDACSVLLVEREAFAIASLVAQIESGLMAPAAIWSDVRTVPGRKFRGLVDGVIGGIPCQEWSLAGRRAGDTGERDLWSPARRVLIQSGAWFILIENVGGILSAGKGKMPGAERIRRDLRRLGFQVAAVIVRAEDVGLPHERERVFILGVNDRLAHAHGRQSPGWRERSGQTTGGRPYAEPSGSGARLHPGVGQADASSTRREGRGPPGDRPGQCEAAERGGEFVVDATGLGRGEGRPEPIVRRGRSSAIDASELVHAIGGGCDGRPEVPIGRPARRDAEQLTSTLSGREHLSDADSDQSAAHGRDDRQERCLPQGKGRPDDRSALLGGSRPTLRPPGPGDADAWRAIAERAPRLLPAVSRHDLFCLALRAAGAAPAGDPSSGAWVDAQTGVRVHSAVLQAATQSAFRGVADVMATRIDELRLLGNGVADAQGALAIRTVATDLAARSTGAAELVRLMGEA